MVEVVGEATESCVFGAFVQVVKEFMITLVTGVFPTMAVLRVGLIFH
jgi:hypothetical protein